MTFDRSKFFHPRIFGVLFIIIGCAFLYNPTRVNLRLCFALNIIGLIIILILPYKNIPKENIHKNIYDELIFFLITAWVFIAFYFTRDTYGDIFLILVILGIFFIINLMEQVIGPTLKKRIFFLLYILIIIFILVIGQNIINILSM
jgi:hypothetical protein